MNGSWNTPNTLLIGIGNSGRQDDGLGWAFLDSIHRWSRFTGQTEYRYQLQVEDAELISHFQQVVFVDACKSELEGGFEFTALRPSLNFEFSTHQLEPASVLFLCQQLYHRAPQTRLLSIQGTKWELDIGLTQFAQTNLERAFRFFSSRDLMNTLGQAT